MKTAQLSSTVNSSLRGVPEVAHRLSQVQHAATKTAPAAQAGARRGFSLNSARQSSGLVSPSGMILKEMEAARATAVVPPQAYEDTRSAWGQASTATADPYGAAYPELQAVDWRPELANTVNLIGVVGVPVELKSLASGNCVGKTRICNKGPNGRDSWFDVELWGDLAQQAAQQVAKGEQIAVQGRLKADEWTDQMGAKRKTIKVVASSLQKVRRSPRTEVFEQPPVDDSWGTNTEQVEPIYGQPQSSWGQQPNTGYQQPAAAGQGGYPAAGGEYRMGAEEKWAMYFDDPSSWWDNRTNKRNPKAPDFKHKTNGEALWISGRDTPQWVAERLASPDESILPF